MFGFWPLACRILKIFARVRDKAANLIAREIGKAADHRTIHFTRCMQFIPVCMFSQCIYIRCLFDCFDSCNVKMALFDCYGSCRVLRWVWPCLICSGSCWVFGFSSSNNKPCLICYGSRRAWRIEWPCLICYDSCRILGRIRVALFDLLRQLHGPAD